MRVLILKKNLSKTEIAKDLEILTKLSLNPKIIKAINAILIHGKLEKSGLINTNNVKEIVENTPGYVLSSRKIKSKNTVISFGKETIGSGQPCIIAGPCSVESYEQLNIIAAELSDLGITFFRGGAYKPRTSPYSFQGLKSKGLEHLQKIKEKYNLKIVTEVMGIDKIDEVADVADILQIGSRNMFNYSLLEEVGKLKKPILLKRGMSAKMNDFLLAAEYILNGGNKNVILCERGITTFENITRNTLDLSIVPHIKQKSHLPIIVDPSHGTGIRSLIMPMSLAAIACGADGLEIEVHHNPKYAFSDGQQSITPNELSILLNRMKLLS